MQYSMFKPEAELRFSLEGKRSPAIFACNMCASFCGTGGHRALEYMKKLLSDWDIDVPVAKCVTGCCSGTILSHAFKTYLEGATCDSIIMLSCAGGVKTAWMLSNGIPVIAALDSFGSAPVSTFPDEINTTLCKGCGECVISYTGGICPVSGCELGNKYGPCEMSPEGIDDMMCALNPLRPCVWKTIIMRGGDLEMLERLGNEGAGKKGDPPVCMVPPAMARASMGRVLSRSGALVSRLIHIFR